MATKYSDIITLRESSQAYNIQAEAHGAWKSFISNEQFDLILKSVIKSVRNNDIDSHKSFWIDGTYGSGKSHAASVIQHLLSDDDAEVKEYIDQEYSNSKFESLYSEIIELRKTKRLLPVQLYGQQGISHEGDLSLEIQKSVKLALKKHKLDIIVKTDFDNYINNLDKDNAFWELLIKRSPSLSSVAPDCKKLRQLLSEYDTDIINKIREAEASVGISIRLELSSLKQWLIDVQNKLRESKLKYTGILIVWDEFTELMRSDIGLRLLNPLQEITEAFMNSDNDSYFLFITHPSAFNGLGTEESTKTKGRFHYIHYNMDTVSAFKIMSRKFKTVNPQSNEYPTLYNQFYDKNPNILETLSTSSNNPEETKEDLKKVFPIHPCTANLATYYAREIGSSSRSVFQFMACDLVRDFLDDKESFATRNTITADMLWDYVKEDFENDTMRFAAVTERFNTYRLKIESAGETANAVFKGILLLNALNNIAQNPTVIPSEDNIYNLFIGTKYSLEVENALNYLNDNGIIQKNPMGLYSIQFSSLPPAETKIKQDELRKTEFAYTSQVVKYGETAKTEFEKILKGVARQYSIDFYSDAINEYTLLNTIENCYKKAKPYEVFIAFFFARNHIELGKIRIIAENASKNPRFENVAFVVFDTVLDDREYDHFIEYMSIAQVAQQHGLVEQSKTHTKDASDIIYTWINNIKRGNLTYYLRGKSGIQNARNVSSMINNCISPIIFSSGPESLEIIRTRFTASYWKKASVKATVDAVLSYNTKEEIVAKCSGAAKHVEYLLQDSVDDDLNFKSDIDKNHPLYKVCQKVKSIFDHTNKNTPFNLAEKLEVLKEPPFGFYQTYAPMAMLSFALRSYRGQLFDSTGKPREAQHLVDDVVDVFKSWEDKRKNPKLNYQFESKESGELCKNLINVLSLNDLPGYSSVSSLTDARWAITHEFSTMKGFPLWSVKYITDKDHIKTLIDRILKICDSSGEAMRNPNILSETIKLLKQYHLDLKNIIRDKSKFEEGFVNYLRSIEHVNLKIDEINDAIDYLRRHLSGEVGFWKEDEVKDNLKNWRISKENPIDNPLPTIPIDSPERVIIPNENIAERKEKLYKELEEIADSQIKEWILDECKNGNKFIIKIMEDYVAKLK